MAQYHYGFAGIDPTGETVPQKTFNARQLEEKAEEVRICLYVAGEMNRRNATDYYAKDPVYYLENRNEPIDVETAWQLLLRNADYSIAQ
jgi:hypothetical protein